MIWRVEDAEQQFTELIRSADQTPQEIYDQDHLVAVVVGGDQLHQFLNWQKQQASLAISFAELRQICEEEQYVLEVPGRSDRPNPFA
jgi:nicotinic acid mononucleotide adenylyltransferase